jgi:hypothetical protein
VARLSIPGLTTKVPILTVWSTGPGVLFFVLLVILGTLRAYRTADRRLDAAPDDETTDEHPNAIDWATYTTRTAPKLLNWTLGFAYPLYMSVFAYEASYILVALAGTLAPVPGRWLFVGIGVVEAVPTYLLLLAFWLGRIRRW